VTPRSSDLRFIAASKLVFLERCRELDGNAPDIETLRRAERHWDTLLERDPKHQSAGDSRLMRANLQMRIAAIDEDQGETAVALRDRNRALDELGGQSETAYLVAATFVDDARLDAEYPSPRGAEHINKIRRRSLRHAAELLSRAIDYGFRDLPRLEADPAFAGALGEPEFRDVMNRLRDLVFPERPFEESPRRDR
jgi:hypothetical protein